MKLFIAESNNTQGDNWPLAVLIRAKDAREAAKVLFKELEHPKYHQCCKAKDFTFQEVPQKEGILLSFYEFDPIIEIV